MMPGPPQVKADMDGDGVEDLVVAAHCTNVLADQADQPKSGDLVAQEVVQDDPVDDFISDPQTPLLQPDPETPTMTAIPSASRLIVSDDLNVRLASIDSSLARIAAAVELIADRLASKEDPSRQ